MQWSDVVKPPSPTHLRQFAGLFLVVFLALAAGRGFSTGRDAWTIGLATAAVVVGLTGIAFPAAVRPIYTGWMIAAFPIGWTVSRLVLATVFFLVVTPMGLVFRLLGRDALVLRQGRGSTYWVPRSRRASPREYFRQS